MIEVVDRVPAGHEPRDDEDDGRREHRDEQRARVAQQEDRRDADEHEPDQALLVGGEASTSADEDDLPPASTNPPRGSGSRLPCGPARVSTTHAKLTASPAIATSDSGPLDAVRRVPGRLPRLEQEDRPDDAHRGADDAHDLRVRGRAIPSASDAYASRPPQPGHSSSRAAVPSPGSARRLTALTVAGRRHVGSLGGAGHTRAVSRRNRQAAPPTNTAAQPTTLTTAQMLGAVAGQRRPDDLGQPVRRARPWRCPRTARRRAGRTARRRTRAARAPGRGSA